MPCQFHGCATPADQSPTEELAVRAIAVEEEEKCCYSHGFDCDFNMAAAEQALPGPSSTLDLDLCPALARNVVWPRGRCHKHQFCTPRPGNPNETLRGRKDLLFGSLQEPWRSLPVLPGQPGQPGQFRDKREEHDNTCINQSRRCLHCWAGRPIHLGHASNPITVVRVPAPHRQCGCTTPGIMM